MKRILFLTLLSLLLAGCGQKAGSAPVSSPETAAPPETAAVSVTLPTVPTVDISQEAVALAEAPLPPEPVILTCEAPGTQEERCASAVIDFSNTADGYIMAQYFGEPGKRLKLRITGPTTVYTYNLPENAWTVFPLSDGSGSYKVNLYRNTSGSRYAAVMSAGFEAELSDAFAPFLRPNQYVDYSDAPNTLALASVLCTGLEQPLEKVAAVYDHVVTMLSYDYEKAATVQSGYLPVLDQVLEEKTGICFDYAALMAAMLRSQEVPCKLVVGYAGSVYHAWISVWTEENGWVDGAIFFDGNTWKRMDPTFASSSQRSDEIMKFIESGSYTEKYLY